MENMIKQPWNTQGYIYLFEGNTLADASGISDNTVIY